MAEASREPGGEAVEPAVEIKPEGTAKHDPATPPALVEFMSGRWAPQPPVVEGPAERAPWCARRRAALSERFPGDWLVVPTGGLKVRANDTDYPFRPGSDFFWLTGSHEPDSVLVMSPHDRGGHDSTIYAEPRADRSTPAFFTDRRYGELWVGPRLGLEETKVLLGVDAAPREDLAAALKAAEGAMVRVLRGVDAGVDALVPTAAGQDAGAGEAAEAKEGASDVDGELAEVLSELRLVKDEHEVTRVEEAVAATVRAFEDVVRCLPEVQGAGERWVEGTFNRRARAEGNDVGYGSIVACGHHACTLHWTRNDGPVAPGELLLVDAGVEGHELYTADVTRTLPVSGRFSERQRDVYEAVWRAQRAGIAEVRPGAPFLAPHRAAMQVLVGWLIERGILTCSAEEALDEQNQFHRRYTLHGTSHMLGLDVHDCAAARNQSYRETTLVPGMVLTVEPGLYLQPDDLTVPEPYRGIGVRIEDDVVVTDEGCRVLSEALPTGADDVETWMAALLGTA